MKPRSQLSTLFLVLSVAVSVSSQLLAIDFGTQYIKASVVHSGAGKAFTIVENHKSERKFLNALGFYSEERFYESSSLSKRTKLPQNCFLFSRLLIDLNRQPSLLSVVKKDLFLQYIQENLEDQFLAEFFLEKFPEETNEITLLEVLTMILKYVRMESEKFAKAPIKDAVLVLPNYWSIHQRNFLLEAAAIADIHVLSIVSENSAAAINYALSNRNHNKTENILFYNVGSNTLQMTLVEFRQVSSDKSPKPVESIFVQDDYGKPYVGGLRLDSIICQYFAKVFEEKHGKALNQRGMIKLLAESNKVKEVLSANKDANIFVEGIMDGIDFVAKITRQEFEQLADEVFGELVSPIKRFLFNNDLKPTDVDAIELIGGGARVPKLQSMIVDIFEGKKEKVGTHINGDEAMALGGAFFAANSSKKFKVKGINLYDGFDFEMRLVLRNLDSSVEEGDEEYFFKNATVFKKKSRFGLSKEVNFKCKQNLKAELYSVDTETAEEELLRSYELDQIEAINETQFKVSLTFVISPTEVVELKDSKFTYKREEVQTYTEKVKKEKPSRQGDEGDDNSTDEDQKIEKKSEQTEIPDIEDKNQTDEKQKDPKKTKKEKEKVEYETVERNKTVSKKYERQLTSRITYNIKKMEQSMSEKSRKMLKKYEKAEEQKHLLAQAKDRLEGLIYEVKDRVESKEFIRFSKEQEREKLLNLAAEKQTWFEEEFSKDPQEYKEHHKSLSSPLEKVKRRITEHSERQQIKKQAIEQIKHYRNLTKTIQNNKQWITEDEVNELYDALDVHEEKVFEFYEEMTQNEDHEDCIFRNKDMMKEADAAKDKYFALKAKPKPKKEDSSEKTVSNDEL